jgi:hypothetical protein
MAKFVWQPPDQEPLAFAIRQERVAVGRDAGNDLRIPESAVSARHAVVITRMGISTVHDLNSSNGTWVNGKRIESQALRHGDTVQFGRLKMHFIDETMAASPSSSQDGLTNPLPSAATVTLRDRAANPHATGAFRAAAAAPQQPPAGPDLSELDRLMGSIRSHRSSEQQQSDQRLVELRAEWQKVMDYCQALKAKLAHETRVRFFEVSERRNEVVIRIERRPGQPTQLLMLTFGHQDIRGPAADGLWLRLAGSPDKRFDKCAEATRELVTHIAHLLA